MRQLGYTTVQRYLREYRAQLAAHRKNKRTWTGRKEEYETTEREFVGQVLHYRAMLREPYYANKVRKARNRKRRKPRAPLPHRNTWIEDEATGEVTEDSLYAHLPWMVRRIKLKRFKNKKHLAFKYRKPMRWINAALEQAIEYGMITEEEIKQSFRRPGRPKKGKPRGPYKKR
jgi:hypothetical protein